MPSENRNLLTPRDLVLRRLTPYKKGALGPQNRSRSHGRYLSTWKWNSGLKPLSCGRTARKLILRRKRQSGKLKSAEKHRQRPFVCKGLQTLKMP
jgi:hypothetical protein